MQKQHVLLPAQECQDSCPRPPVSHTPYFICFLSFTQTLQCHMIWRKKSNFAHLSMCVHICRNTHTGTETTYLNKRHIEFLHTDTQTPASTPPTTATITAPTGPLKHNPRGDILTHEQCQSWNYVQEERGGRSHIWCKEKGMQHLKKKKKVGLVKSQTIEAAFALLSSFFMLKLNRARS